MRGSVLTLTDSTQGHRSIWVKTDYGVLSGFWNGGTPNLNAIVFFELEFDPELVTEHETGFIAVSPTPGDVLLAGIVEAWHDGVLYLRIGEALVQIELAHTPAPGSWIAVRGRRLRLFDTNL